MIGKISAPRGKLVERKSPRTSWPGDGTPPNWNQRCARTAPGTSECLPRC